MSLPEPVRDPRMESVERLFAACEAEPLHSRHVASLAEQIFEALWPLHRYGNEERFWLLAGAYLHDIGWMDGGKGHHKRSAQIILSSPILTLGTHDRSIIANIARYHRKALPSPDHSMYAALSVADRQVVDRLAGMVRLADGLDAYHDSTVTVIRAESLQKGRIRLAIGGQPAWRQFTIDLDNKSALLERAFGRDLEITWPRH